MQAIIVGPENNGEGVYTLLTEEGEALASHFCSNSSFAPGDLYKNRPERKELFDSKNITEFVTLRDSKLTLDQLLELNKEFYKNEDSK